MWGAEFSRLVCGTNMLPSAKHPKHSQSLSAANTLRQLPNRRGYRCANTRNMIHSIMGRGSCNRDGLGLSFLRVVVAMDWRRITLTRNGTPAQRTALLATKPGMERSNRMHFPWQCPRALTGRSRAASTGSQVNSSSEYASDDGDIDIFGVTK